MNIKPSAMIRNNYNEIAKICRKTKEPVYLTKNGEGDLVVIAIEDFEKREKMLKLREELVRIEEERLLGKKGHSLKDLEALLTDIINEEKENAQKNL